MRKLEQKTDTSEAVTGRFGLGEKNERGDIMVEWATSNEFKIINTPLTEIGRS